MAQESHNVGPAEGFDHRFTIIFLHGKGSDCDEFASELFESEVSEQLSPQRPRTLDTLFPSVRWVFPSAPQTHCERFGGTESQWFDMWAVENPNERFQSQVEGLRQSLKMLREVLAREEALLPRERIFLAGISQGFATAVAGALLAGGTFAGLVGLCAWMPRRAYEAIQASKGPDRASYALTLMKTPIFLGHSKGDGVVPVENGRDLRDYLSESRSAIQWHEYESNEHWVVEPEGVDDLVMFLRSHMRRLSQPRIDYSTIASYSLTAMTGAELG
ncbi:hypothetical protein TruAng_001611 [Truncatella angustata]|nr:hypothetical protein TruAng_001611 [Truncatella angustata]